MRHCYCGRERAFFTREEKVEMLKEYRSTLENELQGVIEKIKELEKSK